MWLAACMCGLARWCTGAKCYHNFCLLQLGIQISKPNQLTVETSILKMLIVDFSFSYVVLNFNIVMLLF